MNKAELALLERCFAAELQDGPPIVQVENAVARKLASGGYLEHVTLTMPGRFALKVSGYKITLKGHMTYCMSCADSPPGGPPRHADDQVK